MSASEKLQESEDIILAREVEARRQQYIASWKQGVKAFPGFGDDKPAHRERFLKDWNEALQLYPGYQPHEISLLQKYANVAELPRPGFVVDFSGVLFNSGSLWSAGKVYDGLKLPLPMPGDFHAETIEWIGLLKAVDSANDRFVILELGAGLGPWVVAGGVNARSRGISDIRLYAVEGDQLHCELMRDHFRENGFAPEDHTILQAAVGVTPGTVRWPKPNHDAQTSSYNLRPVTDSGDYMGREFSEYVPIEMVAFNDLLMREPFWNLVHIDIQGHEVDICRSAIKTLNERVAWVVVGTHSRKIDGDLLELMKSVGWILENEKPAKFIYNVDAPTLESMTTLDGTQVWRNPRID